LSTCMYLFSPPGPLWETGSAAAQGLSQHLCAMLRCLNKLFFQMHFAHSLSSRLQIQQDRIWRDGMYAMSTLCQGCCYRAKHVRLCPKREVPLSMHAGMQSPNTILSCHSVFLLATETSS